MKVTNALAVAAALLAGAQTGAHADTLDQAMAQAVASNPTLGAQRARLRASREALPQAWAEALPQVSLSGDATRSQSHGPGSVDGPRIEDWGASASATQLLFSSGGFLASTRVAKASIRGAVADYQLALEDLLLQVATAYAGVRQNQEIVAARQTTVNNLSTLFDYANAQFDAGVVTRTDVAQAQARLAQARTQLVQAQGALAAADQAYQRLVGVAPGTLEAPPETAGLPSDLDTALETAGNSSPTLLGAIANADQAHSSIWATASDGLPRLTLNAGASLSDDLHANTPGSGTSGDSVGLRLSWNLFDGGATWSRTRQQRALSSAANLDLAAAQRNVREDVTNAWTGLASARSAVVSAREQVQASELAYQGIRLEQETGLRSTIDVLNQEQDLLDARLALASAERDLVVAERQLLASTGQLEAPPASVLQQQSAAPAPAATPEATPPVTPKAAHHRRTTTHRRHISPSLRGRT